MRKSVWILLPLFGWCLCAASLTALVVLQQEKGVDESSSVTCVVRDITTPSGLGTLSPPEEAGAWRLTASPRTGNGLMVFHSGLTADWPCGPLLRLSGFRQAPGFDVKLFARTRDGTLEDATLTAPFLETAVFDVADLIESDLDSVAEWGLAISPAHPNVLDQSTTGGYVQLESAALLPRSPLPAIRVWLTEWLSFHPWSGPSINVVGQPPGEGFAWWRPNFAFGVSLIPAVLIALLIFRRERHKLLISIALPVALAWLLSDLAWQRNLAAQNQETRLFYPDHQPPGVLAQHSDERLAAISRWIESHVTDPQARIFIVAPGPFERERLYYHLLPRRAAWIYPNWTNLPTGVDPHEIQGDYLVLFPGTALTYDAGQGLLLRGRPRSLPVRPVAAYEDIQLLEIHAPPEGG